MRVTPECRRREGIVVDLHRAREAVTELVLTKQANGHYAGPMTPLDGYNDPCQTNDRAPLSIEFRD